MQEFKKMWAPLKRFFTAREQGLAKLNLNYPYSTNTFRYLVLVTGGFFIDRLIKRRSENLEQIQYIRAQAEKQWQENRDLIKALPVWESGIGFYLYYSPKKEILEGIINKREKLQEIKEKNHHLKTQLKQLKLVRWKKMWSLMPREDYRQALLVMANLEKWSQELECVDGLSEAMYFYMYQQYPQAQEVLKKHIRLLEDQQKLQDDKPNKPGISLFVKQDVSVLLAVSYNLLAKTDRVLNDISSSLVNYQNAENCFQAIESVDIKAKILTNHALLLNEEAWWSQNAQTQASSASNQNQVQLKISHDEALKLHEQALTLNPYSNLVLANYARGLYLHALDPNTTTANKTAYFAKAKSLLDKAVDKDPENVTYRLYRGILAMEQAKTAKVISASPEWQAAQQDFDEGLKQSSNHTSLLCRSALVELQKATDASSDKNKKSQVQTYQQNAHDKLRRMESELDTKCDLVVDLKNKKASVQDLLKYVEGKEKFNYENGLSSCQNIARFFYQKATTNSQTQNPFKQNTNEPNGVAPM